MTNDAPLILIVDDESDALTYLFSLLESDGYQVATCPRPLEALKFVAEHKPKVVISDVRMPDMEGLELLSKIKYVSPETRVILVSAYGDWDMYLEAVQRGAEDLIPKPYKTEEILRLVSRVLETPSAR